MQREKVDVQYTGLARQEVKKNQTTAADHLVWFWFIINSASGLNTDITIRAQQIFHYLQVGMYRYSRWVENIAFNITTYYNVCIYGSMFRSILITAL